MTALRLQEYLAQYVQSNAIIRYGCALAAGIMATLTLPPIHIYPLLIPAFSGLLLLLVSAHSPKQAFLIAWWFGFGYFTTGLYWFAYALMWEADKFAWLIPFAVLGLPAILSIYYGIAGYCLRKLSLQSSIANILLFASIFTSVEWLRGHLFGGFPWNLIGYSWGFSTIMLQPAAIFGIYGLSWATILMASLAAALFWPHKITPRKQQAMLLLSLLLILGAFTYGWLRLSDNITRYTDVTLQLVQANIAQPHKWNPELQIAAIQKHIALSRSLAGKDNANLIIWSESSYPFILEERSPPIQTITNSISANSQLITGALRANIERSGGMKLWNSLFIVNSDALIIDYYDKYRLVPFGEFIPLRGLIPMEKKITHGMQDFTPGEGAKILYPEGDNMPGFLPLICYEAIFPDLAAQNSKNAGWIVNITNDAWFGDSTAPYQHLQMARMRAIEQGLPLVRVANSGITAVIDPYGRILQYLPLGISGSIYSKLPEAAASNTIYSRYGDMIFWLLIIASIIAGLMIQRLS